MEKITINSCSGKSEIVIGEKLENLKKYCGSDNPIVITDNNVASLYGRELEGYRKIVIGNGEKSKNLKTLEYIYEKMFEFNADRSSYVAAVGGGVVTDIAGFAASTYMRGLRYGFVSTTLLGQVDASVGGKTGFNLGEAKNLIGVFSQPEFVIIDMGMLATLSLDDYLSGLGEIIKHSIIAGGSFLEKASEAVTPQSCREMALFSPENKELLSYFISESVKIKSSVVEKDEKESGLRRILNLGHTLAHAIEIEEGIAHGKAVLKGIKFSADFSLSEGFLGPEEHKKIISLLENTGVSLGADAERKNIKKLVIHDKKKVKDGIYFVFIRSGGDVFAEKIPAEKLLEAIDDLCVGR